MRRPSSTVCRGASRVEPQQYKGPRPLILVTWLGTVQANCGPCLATLFGVFYEKYRQVETDKRRTIAVVAQCMLR